MTGTYTRNCYRNFSLHLCLSSTLEASKYIHIIILYVCFLVDTYIHTLFDMQKEHIQRFTSSFYFMCAILLLSESVNINTCTYCTFKSYRWRIHPWTNSSVY